MFGNSEKNRMKQEERARALMEKDKQALDKFGLDFDNYTPEVLKQLNAKSARDIATSLAGSKLYSFGALLSGSANESFALELARAQVEQNFILIRQNEEIIRLLQTISNK